MNRARGFRREARSHQDRHPHAGDDRFNRQKGEELDRQFSPAFERVLRELRPRSAASMPIPSCSGSAQHQLTLVSHHPPFDPETGQRGQQMFRQLLTLVERRLGEGGVAERLAAPPSTSGDDT